MDRAEIDQALAKIDLATYLDQQGVAYTESYGTNGLQLNIHECPVCHAGGRKTYVNAETGLGKCFHGACQFGFNRFKLVRAVSGMSGRDLDDHIASIAENQGWMPKRPRKEIIRTDLKLPTKCIALPVNGKSNIAYLAQRRIKSGTAGWFHLSYCDNGWWGYKTLEGDKWMNFGERVIIPVLDLEGKMVSFQGRDITGERDPKYLFPPGYAVAGSHIYNAHNWRDGVHNHIIIGEGAFDAWSIHQAIQDVPSCESMLPVATFGMHLSEGPNGQVAKLLALKERGLRHITFMWDSEKKALALAIKEGLKLAGLGFTTRLALLPPGADPNELSKGVPTPPDMIVSAVFKATVINRISAIKLMRTAITGG
jgi:DNA primase